MRSLNSKQLYSGINDTTSNNKIKNKIKTSQFNNRNNFSLAITLIFQYNSISNAYCTLKSQG